MFRHQALDFAKILSRKAYATRNSAIMQPHFSGSRALVDMNVRWLVGLMTVKVEPKPIQSQYRGHLCAQSMTSEVREERGGSWVESRKLSQVCQLKWVSFLFHRLTTWYHGVSASEMREERGRVMGGVKKTTASI